MIGEKNHRHSAGNPYAQFRQIYSLSDVEGSKMTYEPLTKLQCSPTSDGAGAAIVCSEEFVKSHGLGGQAVEIVGQAMTTDNNVSFETELHDRSCINMVGPKFRKIQNSDLGNRPIRALHFAKRSILDGIRPIRALHSETRILDRAE